MSVRHISEHEQAEFFKRVHHLMARGHSPSDAAAQARQRLGITPAPAKPEQIGREQREGRVPTEHRLHLDR